MPFQRLMFLALAFTHGIHRLVEQFDHVEAIKGNLRLGKSVFDAGNEGGRQVHAGLPDLLGRDAFGFKVLANVLHASLAFALADVNDAPRVHINPQRHIVMPLAGGGFIDAKLGDGGRIIGLQRWFDPVIEDRPDALWIDAQQFSDAVDRHLALDHGQRQGFEQQRKAAIGPRPRHRDVDHFTGRRFNAGHRAMQGAGMLEEIQMLPAALDRIVNAAGNARIIGKSAARRKTNPKMQLVAA